MDYQLLPILLMSWLILSGVVFGALQYRHFCRTPDAFKSPWIWLSLINVLLFGVLPSVAALSYDAIRTEGYFYADKLLLGKEIDLSILDVLSIDTDLCFVIFSTMFMSVMVCSVPLIFLFGSMFSLTNHPLCKSEDSFAIFIPTAVSVVASFFLLIGVPFNEGSIDQSRIYYKLDVTVDPSDLEFLDKHCEANTAYYNGHAVTCDGRQLAEEPMTISGVSRRFYVSWTDDLSKQIVYVAISRNYAPPAHSVEYMTEYAAMNIVEVNNDLRDKLNPNYVATKPVIENPIEWKTLEIKETH